MSERTPAEGVGEHTRALLKISRANRFEYDSERGVFLVSEREVTPAELADLEGRELAAAETLMDEELDDVLQYPVAHTSTHPLMLPKLHQWLNTNCDNRTLFDETREVMRAVFVALRPDMDYVDSNPGGFIGFNVQRVGGEYPHLLFQTLGNCACMGVEALGPFGRRFWSGGVAYFTNHNVDTHAQRVSLLAGLGHIARRAMS